MNSRQFPSLSQCPLCQNETQLVGSHIIPKFFGRGKNFPHENCNTLAFTLFQQDGIIATHTLLGQFVILGFIKHSKNWEWKNTKLDRASGEIGKPFARPFIYGEWLAKMFAEFERISVEDWRARNS